MFTPHEYRLYSQDHGTACTEAVSISAADDEQAIYQARLATPPSTCELWDGSRLVAVIPTLAMRSSASD
jgi:hypothetical protein